MRRDFFPPLQDSVAAIAIRGLGNYASRWFTIEGRRDRRAFIDRSGKDIRHTVQEEHLRGREATLFPAVHTENTKLPAAARYRDAHATVDIMPGEKRWSSKSRFPAEVSHNDGRRLGEGKTGLKSATRCNYCLANISSIPSQAPLQLHAGFLVDQLQHLNVIHIEAAQ